MRRYGQVPAALEALEALETLQRVGAPRQRAELRDENRLRR